MKRTEKINNLFVIKNGEELTQVYLRSDFLFLACVFEKFIKVSVNEFGINPLYCVSLPGYTWECSLNYSGKNLQTVQDKDFISTLENNIVGGISSVMGHRCVKSDESKKILYMDATNLYGHSMIQLLPYDEIEMWHDYLDLHMNKLEKILITADETNFCYFVEVDLRYPYIPKEISILSCK